MPFLYNITKTWLQNNRYCMILQHFFSLPNLIIRLAVKIPRTKENDDMFCDIKIQKYPLLSAIMQHAREIWTEGGTATIAYRTRRYRDQAGAYITIFWPISSARSCVGFKTYREESFFDHSSESIMEDLRYREIFCCRKGEANRLERIGQWQLYNPWTDQRVREQWEVVARARNFHPLSAEERIKGRNIVNVTGGCAIGKNCIARHLAKGGNKFGVPGSSRPLRPGEKDAWTRRNGEILALDRSGRRGRMTEEARLFYEMIFETGSTVCNFLSPGNSHYYFVLEQTFRETLSQLGRNQIMYIPCGLDMAELLTGALTQADTPGGKPTTYYFLPGDQTLIQEWYEQRAIGPMASIRRMRYDLTSAELLLKITDYTVVLVKGKSRSNFKAAIEALPKSHK